VHSSSTSEPPPASEPRSRWFGRRRHADGANGGRGSKNNAHPAAAATEQERIIMEALEDLRDKDVLEVMTPRVDVVALTIPVQAADIARAVRESGHRSFPVVHGDLDDVVGILHVTDLFRTGRGVPTDQVAPLQPIDISRRLRAPLVFPETLGVLDALAEMRRLRRGFALVVDEYGGVAGVLTIKDLLEPLVGDLHDEFDSEEEPDIVRVDASRWLVDGRTSVDEVRERLGIALPDGEYVTLGGYLFAAFGHIPDEGERLAVGQWDLKVVEMDKRRIAKVVARHDQPHAPNPPANGSAIEPAAAQDGERGGTPDPGAGAPRIAAPAEG
jgi:CBS domain containing-hemolysin-like protein